MVIAEVYYVKKADAGKSILLADNEEARVNAQSGDDLYYTQVSTGETSKLTSADPRYTGPRFEMKVTSGADTQKIVSDGEMSDMRLAGLRLRERDVASVRRQR